MEYVHLDYYTDDATALEFFLISAGILRRKRLTAFLLSQESWQSIDIPLSVYMPI